MSFTRWNGNCWDSLIINHHPNVFEDLCVYNNLLFMSGEIDTVNGVYSPMDISWDGNNFVSNGLPHWSGGNPEVCCVYHNAIYFAGTFSDSLGQLYGFVKFDGTNWSMPSPGFGGFIHSMAVYHDELYMSGNYFVGSPSNYIVKWNDTILSAVGNEFYGEAWHLRVIGDKLFAAGGIDTADGIPIHDNLAVWDGSHWSDFSNDTFNNGVMDVAVYNNELYVVGAFTKINGDSIGGVAKYQGWYLGMNDVKKKQGEVVVYPNPTTTTLRLHLSSPATHEASPLTIRITDVLGEELYKETWSGIDTSIDVSKWSEGVYFITIISQDTITIQKFIKIIK